MKVILFGSNGFLGKEVNKFLIEDKFNVISLNRQNCDITDNSFMENLKEKGDIVINCTGQLPGKTNSCLENFEAVNVRGANNILNFCRRQKIQKVIHCSTLSVIKRPWEEINEESNNFVDEHNHYSYSKLVGEKMIKNFNYHLILRLPALYGKNGDDIINKLISRSKNNEDLIANENYFANFLYVKDVANYISKIIKSDINGILNIASPEQINIFQLSSLIKDISKSKSKIKKVNEGEILNAKVNNTKFNKSNKYCNVKFRSLSDGLKEIL